MGFNMALNAKKIEEIIKARLPDAEIRVDGDGVRFTAEVKSSAFKGLSRIQQHRLVYDALQSHISGVGNEIQALQLTTSAG